MEQGKQNTPQGKPENKQPEKPVMVKMTNGGIIRTVPKSQVEVLKRAGYSEM
jgi:hypothetical protein